MMCFRPIEVKERGLVPCGKCVACLMRRRSDWRVRIEEELKAHDCALFVTLTYDDAHVPTSPDGKYKIVNKVDLQLYFKRLRKKGLSFRYFLISEYGPKTLRPHYHSIIFGDASLRNANEQAILMDSWQNGFVTIDVVNSERIGYVSNYTLSLSNVPDFCYRNFLLSSRRPAIGASYLTDDMKDYHRSSLPNYYASKGQKKALPKYYKDKLYDDAMKADMRERFVEKTYHSKLISDGINPYDVASEFVSRVADFENSNISKHIKSRKL